MENFKTWHVTVVLTEEDNLTVAQAVLDTGEKTLHGRGEAHRNPTDRDVPRIGDELATCRALIDLGDSLLDTAAADLGRIEGHAVHLTH